MSFRDFHKAYGTGALGGGAATAAAPSGGGDVRGRRESAQAVAGNDFDTFMGTMRASRQQSPRGRQGAAPARAPSAPAGQRKLAMKRLAVSTGRPAKATPTPHLVGAGVHVRDGAPKVAPAALVEQGVEACRPHASVSDPVPQLHLPASDTRIAGYSLRAPRGDDTATRPQHAEPPTVQQHYHFAAAAAPSPPRPAAAAAWSPAPADTEAAVGTPNVSCISKCASEGGAELTPPLGSLPSLSPRLSPAAAELLMMGAGGRELPPVAQRQLEAVEQYRMADALTEDVYLRDHRAGGRTAASSVSGSASLHRSGEGATAVAALFQNPTSDDARPASHSPQRSPRQDVSVEGPSVVHPAPHGRPVLESGLLARVGQRIDPPGLVPPEAHEEKEEMEDDEATPLVPCRGKDTAVYVADEEWATPGARAASEAAAYQPRLAGASPPRDASVSVLSHRSLPLSEGDVEARAQLFHNPSSYDARPVGSRSVTPSEGRTPGRGVEADLPFELYSTGYGATPMDQRPVDARSHPVPSPVAPPPPPPPAAAEGVTSPAGFAFPAPDSLESRAAVAACLGSAAPATAPFQAAAVSPPRQPPPVEAPLESTPPREPLASPAVGVSSTPRRRQADSPPCLATPPKRRKVSAPPTPAAAPPAPPAAPVVLTPALERLRAVLMGHRVRAKWRGHAMKFRKQVADMQAMVDEAAAMGADAPDFLRPELLAANAVSAKQQLAAYMASDVQEAFRKQPAGGGAPGRQGRALIGRASSAVRRGAKPAAAPRKRATPAAAAATHTTAAAAPPVPPPPAAKHDWEEIPIGGARGGGGGGLGGGGMGGGGGGVIVIPPPAAPRRASTPRAARKPPAVTSPKAPPAGEKREPPEAADPAPAAEVRGGKPAPKPYLKRGTRNPRTYVPPPPKQRKAKGRAVESAGVASPVTHGTPKALEPSPKPYVPPVAERPERGGGRATPRGALSPQQHAPPPAERERPERGRGDVARPAPSPQQHVPPPQSVRQKEAEERMRREAAMKEDLAGRLHGDVAQLLSDWLPSPPDAMERVFPTKLLRQDQQTQIPRLKPSSAFFRTFDANFYHTIKTSLLS
eukprot:TRINITY_DN20435_c0_g1_i1.p1 TRINITY_DN20435_c0_g1~~TRINITY_DN20435_c0_g1_i1.p1  ORF type:complete len:1087 (+),score=294.64 TRINITY_DN20435_c0_g1_i1:121-3381(+)